MDFSPVISVAVQVITPVTVVILFLTGWIVPKWTHDKALEASEKKDAEIAKLQEALALERQRSNDATQAGAVTNQLISGLVRLAGDRHGDHPGVDGAAKALPASGGTLDLTGKDLGL